MNRRFFLRGLMATTAAGPLIPERTVWALDQTMVRGGIHTLADEYGDGMLKSLPDWWYQVQAMGQDFDGRGWVEYTDGPRVYTVTGIQKVEWGWANADRM